MELPKVHSNYSFSVFIIRKFSNLNLIFFQAEAALLYDSVFVFAIGLQTLEQSHTLKISNVSCEREQPWDGGLSLINYINAVSLPALYIFTFYILYVLTSNLSFLCLPYSLLSFKKTI